MKWKFNWNWADGSEEPSRMTFWTPKKNPRRAREQESNYWKSLEAVRALSANHTFRMDEHGLRSNGKFSNLPICNLHKQPILNGTAAIQPAKWCNIYVFSGKLHNPHIGWRGGFPLFASCFIASLRTLWCKWHSILSLASLLSLSILFPSRVPESTRLASAPFIFIFWFARHTSAHQNDFGQLKTHSSDHFRFDNICFSRVFIDAFWIWFCEIYSTRWKNSDGKQLRWIGAWSRALYCGNLNVLPL